MGVGWELEARRAEGGQGPWDGDGPREGMMPLCFFWVLALLSIVSSGGDLGPCTRFLELAELPAFSL